MKLTEKLSLIFFAGVATASKAAPRSLAYNGADFTSREYDYVVVGGGTAGLAAAGRLAEDPNVSVGLIDAGEYMPDDPTIEVPANAFTMMGNPKYDWMFQSVPQKYLGGRTLGLPRGKVLGGCSAIDVLTNDRAPKEEHDAWASLGGGKGWDWDGFLPHMKSAERFVGADPFRVNNTGADPDDTFPSQGTDGYIGLSFNNWYSDMILPYWTALKKLGVPVNYDPDSGYILGTYNTPRGVNATTGKRSYSGNTYYTYNAHRSNFVVMTGAQATKVEFEDSKGDKLKANGVTFVYKSEQFTVKVKREVVLSAGAFQSPHLLELSGIGNSTLLKQYGIEPLVDLPGVGENLQDHPFTSFGYEMKPGVTTMDNLKFNATLAAAAKAQYESTHDGILTNSVAMLSFLEPDVIATKKEWAGITDQLDREIERDGTSPMDKAQFAFLKPWLKRKVGQVELIVIPFYTGGGTPKNDTAYVSIFTLVQHVFSRGYVHLNTSDPLAAPVMDPNFYAKSIDRDTVVQTGKFVDKIFSTEPLASLVAARAYPAPNVTSDADWTTFVEMTSRGAHHHLGTAAMASRDIGGVVDGELKVYGTSNLRVADASIIPYQMNFHPTRTCYGIGEAAAALIKKSW